MKSDEDPDVRRSVVDPRGRFAFLARVSLRELGVGADELPVVIAPGQVLRHATPGAVAEYLGFTLERLPLRPLTQ